MAKLLWAEQRAHPPAELTPYGGILASYQFFFNRDPADLAPAIEALQRVVAAEPECSLAWVQLSRLYTANYSFEVAPLETPIDQAVAYAQNGRAPRPVQPEGQGRARRGAPRQGRARGQPGRGAERARPQPGLPRLPRVDRLADDAARRVGAGPGPGATSAHPQSPRHPRRSSRPLAGPSPPRGDRGGLPGRPAVPRPDLLPAGHDAGLLPRAPRAGGRRRGWRWPSCSPRSPTSRAAAAP